LVIVGLLLDAAFNRLNPVRLCAFCRARLNKGTTVCHRCGRKQPDGGEQP
jgi:ribosomal protein L40E